jgi:hypothetical protein
MKNIKPVLCAVVAVALVGMAGCHRGSEGDQFVGKWSDSPQHGVIEIARNGDGFLVKTWKPDGRLNSAVPAVYQDGVLHISSALGAMSFGYDKDHDELTASGVEIPRLK